MEPVKIHPPEGFEVCPTSTQTEIRFRPISKSKPKWEDFGKVEGWHVNQYCVLVAFKETSGNINKNIWPTKEEAEACLALSQLCQWRDKYNEGWRPDWSNTREHKWVIGFCDNRMITWSTIDSNSVLAFKTCAIKDKFREDFSELITIARPLL